ncbi:MAG: hypothetical protein BWY85_00958 [Firmicutes bacterium ADurb.Bin506]|nr:MAG: hypothetical protein BWY85_00958 [Firmicutes bacterium ADurb.Bin506]
MRPRAVRGPGRVAPSGTGCRASHRRCPPALPRRPRLRLLEVCPGDFHQVGQGRTARENRGRTAPNKTGHRTDPPRHRQRPRPSPGGRLADPGGHSGSRRPIALSRANRVRPAPMAGQEILRVRATAGERRVGSERSPQRRGRWQPATRDCERRRLQPSAGHELLPAGPGVAVYAQVPGHGRRGCAGRQVAPLPPRA